MVNPMDILRGQQELLAEFSQTRYRRKRTLGWWFKLRRIFTPSRKLTG